MSPRHNKIHQLLFQMFELSMGRDHLVESYLNIPNQELIFEFYYYYNLKQLLDLIKNQKQIELVIKLKFF